MTWFRKWMILTHRWLGIVLSLLFVVWFVSGIAMIYARGMPSLTPALRLERLAPLDLASIRLTPQDAAQRTGLDRAGRAVLLMSMGRPAYRFGAGTVFADNGELLPEIGQAEAMSIASRFMNLPEDRLHHSMQETVDQWTIGQRRLLPLHKITVDDPSRTELYISRTTGEVAVLTTRGSRTLAWVAAIPHWFYFTSLRVNDELWRQVVIGTAALGCVLALMGIVLGVIQFRRRQPHIPYSGWMRWHYITGVVFGVFTLTWVFSGMLSMEPFGWASGGTFEIERSTFTGGPIDLAQYPAMDAAAWKQLMPERSIKEVEFIRIQGDPYYLVRTSPEDPSANPERIRQEYAANYTAPQGRVLVSASPLHIRHEPFSVDSLMTRVKEAVPDTPIAESQVLSDYDSYYYSRDRQAPLPVLRIKFDDPDKTWLYIDPGMGQLVAQVHRLDRVERWIYNGFHSLDFSFWYSSRLWDVGMILLSLGCIVSSGIGLLLGMGRLVRKIKPGRA